MAHLAHPLATVLWLLLEQQKFFKTLLSFVKLNAYYIISNLPEAFENGFYIWVFLQVPKCLKNWKMDKIKTLHSKTVKKKLELYDIPKLRNENCIKRIKIEKQA